MTIPKFYQNAFTNAGDGKYIIQTIKVGPQCTLRVVRDGILEMEAEISRKVATALMVAEKGLGRPYRRVGKGGKVPAMSFMAA